MTKAEKLYKEIEKDIVKNSSYALHTGPYSHGQKHEADIHSEGIRRLCDASREFCKITSELMQRYRNHDSGRLYDPHDPFEMSYKKFDIKHNTMKGLYTTKYGDVYICSDDGIHTTICFHFER